MFPNFLFLNYSLGFEFANDIPVVYMSYRDSVLVSTLNLQGMEFTNIRKN